MDVRVTALRSVAVDSDFARGVRGVMSAASRLPPETLGDVVVLLVLANVASVPALAVNPRLESAF